MGHLAAFHHKNNFPSAPAKAEPVLRVIPERNVILRASKQQEKWQRRKPTPTLVKTARGTQDKLHNKSFGQRLIVVVKH